VGSILSARRVFARRAASARRRDQGRARGNALGPTRRSSRSPAVVVRSRSPRCATLVQERLLHWSAHPGVLASPSWHPVRATSCLFRGAEPDASRYPASARIDSSFACLESWHRAPLLAEEELGVHEGAGCRRTPRPTARRKGCASYLQIPRPQPRNGSCHGTLQRERLLTKVLVAKRAGMVSRLVAGARSSVVRTPGGAERARRARSPFFCEEESPPNHTRGGRHVGLGIRLTGFARNTATEVSGRALPLHPPRGAGSRSLARAESDPYRTQDRRRSHPSEERRCLPPHGRANVPCGGRKRRSYVLPPCNARSRKACRWWARSVERHRVAVS